MLHPLGKLVVKQTVVPLNLARHRQVRRRPRRRTRGASRHRASTARRSDRHRVQDAFAPAQFFEMTRRREARQPVVRDMDGRDRSSARRDRLRQRATAARRRRSSTRRSSSTRAAPRPRRRNRYIRSSPTTASSRRASARRRAAPIGAIGAARFQNRAARAGNVAVTKPRWAIASTDGPVAARPCPGVEAGKPHDLYRRAARRCGNCNSRIRREAKKRQIVRAYELVRRD